MARLGVLMVLPLLLLGWLQGCGGSGKGEQAVAVYIGRRADQCSDMPACTASSSVTSCPASFGSGAGDDWDSMSVYSGSGTYEARYGHGVVDFGGQILIIGGLKVSSADSAEREGLSDIWTLSLSKKDPTAAIQRIEDDAGFLGRGLFSSVVHVDGSATARVYIFGGMTGASTTASDAWRSVDGDGGGTWENVASPSTTPRINSVLLSSAGRLFLIGGGDSDCDVKVSSKSDPISWATAELPTGTTELCGPSAGIVYGTRIIVYSFRSDRMYAQILQWSEAETSLSVLKSRWELTTDGGSTLVFSGVGKAVLVGRTPYIVGSSSSTGRQRIFHAAEGGLDTASAWTEKGANSCGSGAWCDTSTGTAAIYSDGLLCLSGGLKSDPQRRSLKQELGHGQQGERRAVTGSSGVWCSGAQFDAPAVIFEERNVVLTRCGGDFFTPLNAAGYYMLCPEGQGGGSWSVISSLGSVAMGNGKVTVYAKTEHTTDEWSTVSPSPTSCGVIEAAPSPPTPAPSPTPSPTPPSTPSPTPAPTPTPTPPPKLNGIDPCCNSACDFSSCQPNGVIDATGGSMIIVYGYSLWDATSISVGGRECIPAASASTLGCGPTTNYGGLADSQCQCISPPGSGAMPVEVRGGSGGAAWTSVKDVVYGQVYATSFDLAQQSSRPAAGGGSFSVSGSGFGRSGALGKSLYASVADNAGIWADFNGPAGRISSRVEWVSETSIKGSVPAGVGAGVTVSLRLEKSGWTYTVPNSPTSMVFSYAYDPPSIASITPATSYQGLTVTLAGRNFGAGEYSLGIYAVSVGGSSCSSVTWLSDSSMLCDLPASGSGSNHTVVVTVAGQSASLPASFSYTGASKEYRFGTGASASDARSSLKAWSKWLAGLIGVSEEQVYAKVIEGVGGRRQIPGSIILVKLLGTKQEPNSFAAAELALSTLVSDGKLSGSPVPLMYIQAGNIKTSISQTPSPSTSGSGSPSPSGQSSSSGSSNTPGQPSIFVPVQSSDSTSNVGLAVGVVCAVLAVVAAGYLLRQRLHKRSSQAEIASGQGAPEPSAPSLPGTGSYVNGAFSYISRPSGPGEVDSIGQHRAQPRHNNVCDQCRRSGFAVCIHGLVEPESIEVVSDSQVPSLVRGNLGAEAKLPPHDEAEDDEHLCVVCLDAPREAVVVHNDAEYTTHQVLCLDCAARIAGSGGACPMCRAPIFAVLQARDSAQIPPSIQRD